MVALSSLDFTLPDHRGNSFHLADRRGQGSTVLVFYRGHWCPYCRRYLSRKIEPALPRFIEAGAIVLGISPEPVSTAADFARAVGISFPLLSDHEGHVIDLFNARSRLRSALPHPAIVILDADLQIVFRHIDRNYKKRTTVRAMLTHLLPQGR